jgi:hypothetical protein
MGFNGSYHRLQEEFLLKNPEISAERLEMELKRIQVIAAKTKDLVGKCVIDLGAGAEQSLDKGNIIVSVVRRILGGGKQHPFHPWYCRILQEANANPVAIDLASNEKEGFASHRLDLTDPSSLDIFEPNTFDAANNFGFTVPSDSRISYRGVPPSLLYNFGLSRNEVFELDSELREKMRQLLKEGGTYTIAEFIYRKRNKQLVKEGLLYQQ